MSLFPRHSRNTECLDALFRKLSQIFWGNVVRKKRYKYSRKAQATSRTQKKREKNTARLNLHAIKVVTYKPPSDRLSAYQSGAAIHILDKT